MKRRTPLSIEQRQEILARVDELKKVEGLTLEEAWAKAGTGHMQSYYAWKASARKKPAKAAKRSYRKRQKITVEAAPAPQLAYQIFVWEDGRVTREDFRRAA